MTEPRILYEGDLIGVRALIFLVVPGDRFSGCLFGAC